MREFQQIEWEACLLEPQRDREIENYIRRELGQVPEMVRYLLPSPWVARSVAAFAPINGVLAYTEQRLAQMISVVVSHERSCRFCYAQVRAMLRMQGRTDAEIRQLEGDLLAAELDPRDRAALEFARRISRGAPPARGADLDALCRKGFERAAAIEIAVVAVDELYFNLLATLPAMPPQQMEAMPDRLAFRLFRRMIRKSFARHVHAGRPTPLPDDARKGVFGPLIASLDGLPTAMVLRRALDDAFASPVLKPRTKALIFGVIGRGLGCTFTQSAARGIAGEHGLGPSRFDEALAHLSAPDLDPVENALLSEARHTIRYRPAELQRRARKLLDHISVPQFVDFVGTAALANSVTRLALVLEPAP